MWSRPRNRRIVAFTSCASKGDSAARKPNSFGLLGLKERAYLLGGDASVSTEPGRGTEIEVRFPLARSDDPQ